MGEKPLYSFGVITDVQYADVDPRPSFWGVMRYYRNALNLLDEAVKVWNEHKASVQFALHLGDIVDGWHPKATATDAVDTVLARFRNFNRGPVYHLIGNHCLYNLTRDTLHQKLGIHSLITTSTTTTTLENRGAYYDFSPHPGFRFVVLDTYDISILGWPEGHPHKQQAKDLLHKNNPNQDKNSPEGLDEFDKRWVAFNGALSEHQLNWLQSVLEDAQKNNQKVLIFSHVPIHHEAGDPVTTVWNTEEVTKIIQQYDCVKLVMSGHDHDGGYHLDKHSVHHIVLPGIIECDLKTNAFGTVHVYEDRIEMEGVGKVESKQYTFK